MKAFTKKQATELGESILNQFEDMLSREQPMGKYIKLPIQLKLGKGSCNPWKDGYESGWCSAITLDIPYFMRTYPLDAPEFIDFNRWLKENKSK